jgi:hypothetical protein
LKSQRIEGSPLKVRPHGERDLLRTSSMPPGF